MKNFSPSGGLFLQHLVLLLVTYQFVMKTQIDLFFQLGDSKTSLILPPAPNLLLRFNNRLAAPLESQICLKS